MVCEDSWWMGTTQSKHFANWNKDFTFFFLFLFLKTLKQIYFIQEYLFSVALFVYHSHLYSFLCFEASAAVNIATLSLLVMQNITTDV